MTPATIPLPDPLAARRVELAADGFVSVADAMAFLSLGETEVYALMGDRTIAWARHGKRRLVSKRSLVEFGAARLVDVTPPTEG